MKWLCLLRVHKWETIREVSCVGDMASVFKNRYADTSILFQRCSYCPEVRAMLSDGVNEKKVGIGMAARSVIQHIPRYANDPFLKKIATLGP
jgi:hypothetical protein